MSNTIQLEIGSHVCEVSPPEYMIPDSAPSWQDWLEFSICELPEEFKRWTGILDGEEHLLKAKDSITAETLAERKAIRASEWDRMDKDLPDPLREPYSHKAQKEAHRVAAEIIASIVSSETYIAEQNDYDKIDAILEKTSSKLKSNQQIVIVPTRDGDILTPGSAFIAVIEPTNMITSDVENNVFVVCKTPYWVRAVSFINDYMNGEVDSLEESLQDYNYFKIVEEISIPRNPAVRHWEEYDKYSIVDNEKYPIELPPPPEPPARKSKTGTLKISVTPIVRDRITGETIEYEAPEEARHWHWDSHDWGDFIRDRSGDFTTIQTSPNNGGARFSVNDVENGEHITSPYVIL